MADEIVKIIRIESDGAEQTVAGLVAEIKNLTEAMNGVQKGTEEYSNILKSLIENQDKLGKAMKANKQETTAAEGSYNALVKQMSALKKQWRETTDEVARKELGKEIKGISEKLSKMDQSIGDFRRNVGNYAGSIKDAFGLMGGAAKGMVGPLNSVKAGFTALSAHPLVAVLTALAALLINGIAKGFKSSEENMNKLRTAFSGFKAIGDAITGMFQKLAGWIGDVANAAINLADKLGLLSPKFKERQEMTKKQIELEKKERDAIVQKAKLETQAAELRAKASEEENYSAEQRIQFLKEAQQKEEDLLNIEKAILVEKFNQLSAEIALNGSTAEELTKQQELKAEILKIDAQIADSKRNTNRQINAINRRSISEAQQANQARLNLEKDLIQQEYDLAVKGSDDQLRLAKELRDKELEIQLETLKGKIKNRKDYEKAVKLAMEAYNRDIQSLEAQHALQQVQHDKEIADVRLKSYNQNSVKYYQEAVRAATKYHSDIKELLDNETDQARKEELQKIEADALQTMYNLADSLTDAEVAQTDRINQLILNSTRPMSAYYREQINQYAELIDYWEELGGKFSDVMDEENEINVENQLRIQELNKARNDAIANYRKAIKEEHDLAARYAKDQEYWSKMYEENWYWVWDLSPKVMDQLKENKETLAKYFNEIRLQIGKYVHGNFDAVAANLQEVAEKQFDAIKQIYGEEKATKAKEEVEAYYRKLFGVDSMDEITGEVVAKVMQTQEEAQKVVDELFKYNLLPESLRDEYLQTLEALTQNEADLLNERYDNWMNLFDGIAKLSGSIGDAYEAELKHQVKNGKKSEEQAKAEFENVKRLRMAEVIINTLAGATAAFMGWQDKGQPWGAIIGAVQAAATLASGWAQLRQIQDTEFGSTKSGGGGSTMMAQVTPVMPDYNPQMSGTLTGQQETEELVNAITEKPIRAYVVESDITNAQNLANQRATESTF